MITARRFYVYILTTDSNTVLYVGVTSDLVRRIDEHRSRRVPGFTHKYNVTKLVYFETYEGADQAIEREKQLKAGSRQKKMLLIEARNSEWRDLYDGLLERYQLQWKSALPLRGQATHRPTSRSRAIASDW